MNRTARRMAISAALCLAIGALGACAAAGQGEGEEEGEGEGPEGGSAVLDAADPSKAVDISLCDPANGPLSLTIDNPYLPFTVGDVHVLEGMEGGTDPIKLQYTVLDETEVVLGVTTRVVEEQVWEDTVCAGTQRHFVAQAPDGTVCFYGSQGGGTEEEWRAGESNAVPAILMPAHPAVGMVFEVIHAPPHDVSSVEVTKVGEEVVTPGGSFTDTVTLLPQETGPTLKKYAACVEMIDDDGVELVSH